MTSPNAITIRWCRPMEALFAQLEAEHAEAQRDHDYHQDAVMFPETRCGVCQHEDPEQRLSVSGGIQLCDGCLDVPVDSL